MTDTKLFCSLEAIQPAEELAAKAKGNPPSEIIHKAPFETLLDTPPAGGLMPVGESAEACACLLKLVLRASKHSLLGRGRIFYMAKSSLHHGEWARIWRLPKSERPPVSKRSADKYALIGQEFGDANEKWPSHLVNQLPASVDALHYLAEMGRQLVLELIVEGTIREGLTAGRARELRASYRPDLRRKRPLKLDRWLARLAAHLEALQTNGSIEDVRCGLSEAAAMLRAYELKAAAST